VISWCCGGNYREEQFFKTILVISAFFGVLLYLLNDLAHGTVDVFAEIKVGVLKCLNMFFMHYCF